MILIPFVDHQKVSLFLKFGGYGPKIESATPISILNFSRAWQSYLVSYALQIFVHDGSSIGQHMIFSSIFVTLPRKQKFEERYFFFSTVFPTWYKKS